jgi:hypothetical protein
LRSIELAFTIWRGAGITPIDYDGDLKESLKHAAPDGFDAVIDTVGHGYVELAIELAIELGVAPERIDRPSSPDGLALCITTDIVYIRSVCARLLDYSLNSKKKSFGAVSSLLGSS